MDEKEENNNKNGTSVCSASLDKYITKPYLPHRAMSTTWGSEAGFLNYDLYKKITSVPILT